MKKILCVVGLVSLGLSYSYSQALKINSSSKIGINTEPTDYQLTINGDLSFNKSKPCICSTLGSDNNYLIIKGTGECLHMGIGGGDDAYYKANSTLTVCGGDYNTYALYVDGKQYSTSSANFCTSDGNTKKNISKVDKNEMLSKLLNVEVKSFEFKSKEELLALHNQKEFNFPIDTIEVVDSNTGQVSKKTKVRIPNLPKGNETGCIAQELKDVFPDLVTLDTTTNMYAVNYNGFIPILISSVKAQQEIIDQQSQEISDLIERLNNIERSLN